MGDSYVLLRLDESLHMQVEVAVGYKFFGDSYKRYETLKAKLNFGS